MKRIAIIALLPFVLNACGPSQQNGEESMDPGLRDSLLERGDVITQAVFDSLRSNLMIAVADSGFSGAIRFCNIEAMPLTASLEEQFGVEIRRATDKPRNTANRADNQETAMIRSFLDTLAVGGAPHPVIEEMEGAYHYFKPIFIMPLCLNCHGEEGISLNPQADSTVRILYPGDQATGYRDKALRGTWHLVFGTESGNNS